MLSTQTTCCILTKLCKSALVSCVMDFPSKFSQMSRDIKYALLILFYIETCLQVIKTNYEVINSF